MGTDWTRTRRMVLRERFSEAEVEDFAQELGWTRQGVDPADPEEGIDYHVFWAPPGAALALHYTEDDLAGDSYVMVIGKDAAAVRGAQALVEPRLKTWRSAELLAEVDRAVGPVALARAVLRAGLGAPEEFNEEFFARIGSALQHPDRLVRETAVWAVTFSPYAEYQPALTALRDGDEDPDVRANAEILLEGFDEAEIRKQ
ncbi:HEAT repeat domain-containing protein [Nocardiopsis sediminis]|uniref:HEAT repeat domain-containing protein n=1 Tax=Nocardiopsis sediminis TaxID=1778267 RepID=A0ABV8FV06_9ACTN